MSIYTRTALIERAAAALESTDANEIAQVQDYIRRQCYRHNISWLKFLVTDVIPYINSLKVPRSAADAQATDVVCPYCSVRFRNMMGLRAHLGRKHAAQKSSWSKVL